MANTYSAGIVTAYGAAKQAGYTGTYEQFCADQANFARYAQQVREDKESVEQTVETFTEETVPEAVRSVTDEGTEQIGLVDQAGTTQVQNVNNAGTTQVDSVNQAGSEKVAAVNQAGTTQVNAVNSAGTTQVGNVNTAGTTQVGNVQNEGATQVQAVEDKGAEVLDSIPSDYSDLAAEVTDLSRQLSDVAGVDEWYDADLWQVGHILSLSGLDSGSPTYNRMRTKTFIPGNVMQIVTDANYGFYIYCYDKADGTYLGMWNGTTTVKEWTDRWHTGTVDIKALQGSYRLRLLAARTNSAEPQLAPADNAQMFRFVSFTDESLSITGKAADAKVTGDRLNALGIYDTTSGDFAAFSDGADGVPMRSLVATIDAGQDLHGYGNPWIGGYGKNLLPMTVDGIKALNNVTFTENSCVMNGVTYTILTDNAGNVTGIRCNGTASAVSVLWIGSMQLTSGDAIKVAANTSVTSEIFFRMSGPGKGTYTVQVSNGQTYTAESDIELFGNIRIGKDQTVSNKVFYPVVCKSTETDTAFEPYENFCPFSGHTGMTGKRTGKNLYDIRKASADLTGNTLTRNGNELIWTANNNAWAGYSMIREKRIMLRAGVTYTVSAYCTVLARDANYSPRLCLRNNNATIIRSESFPSTDNTEQRISFQYTPSEDIVVYMSAVITGATAGNASVRVRNPMVEIGSAVTDYEPYAEADISVTFPSTAGDNGTIYGATLDVVSGVLTVDKQMAVIDGNRTLYNVVARTNTVKFAVSASPTMAGGVRESINVISDKLPYNWFTFYNSDIIGLCGWRSVASENPGLWMSIPIEAGSTDESIKAWLNANPITCVYPLKDPVKYQLTPQEVTTLLGHNVVQTDVGPVSVTAPRDTKMYVDNKIAEAIAAALNA